MLKEMVDSVSGVPGSLNLSVLAWYVASVVIAIIGLKIISYYMFLSGKSRGANRHILM